MVVCQKCGQDNKTMGMCKRCGFVNAPKLTLRERINEMSRKQKVLGTVLAAINVLWFAAGIIGSVLITIFYIFAASMGANEFVSFMQSSFGVEVDVSLPLFGAVSGITSIIGSIPFIIICVAVCVLAVGFGAFMSFCMLKGTVDFGWQMIVIQVFWIAAAVFSIWGITEIDHVICSTTFFIAVVMSALLMVYRKYEFST